MNWREVLDKLPLPIVRWFNHKVTESALQSYYTAVVRCHWCEAIESFWTDLEGMELVRLIKEKGWAPAQQEVVPGFVRFLYFCPDCKHTSTQ